MTDTNPKRKNQMSPADRQPRKSGPPQLPPRAGRGSKSITRKGKKVAGGAGKWWWIGGGLAGCGLLLVLAFWLVGRGKTEVQVASTPVIVPDQTNGLPVATESNEPDIAKIEDVASESSIASTSEVSGSLVQSESTPQEINADASAISTSETAVEVAGNDDNNAPESTDENMAAEASITDERTDAAADEGGEGDVVNRVLNEASLLMQQKKYKEAVASLNRASFKYKTEIRPDFYLGLIYSGVGANEPATAEKYLKRALERQPAHVATLNNLALVQIKNKKFRAAWTYFSNSMKEQQNTVANQNLGRLLNQAEILGMKKEDVKSMKALNPDPQKYDPHRGWFYLPLDDSTNAQSEYREFCRDGDLEDRSCSFCLGHGAVKCRVCGGKRNILITGTATDVFRVDGGARTVVTSTPTSALVNCGGCNGSGRLDCPHCNEGRDPSLDGPRGRGR